MVQFGACSLEHELGFPNLIGIQPRAKWAHSTHQKLRPTLEIKDNILLTLISDLNKGD